MLLGEFDTWLQLVLSPFLLLVGVVFGSFVVVAGIQLMRWMAVDDSD